MRPGVNSSNDFIDESRHEQLRKTHSRTTIWIHSVLENLLKTDELFIEPFTTLRKLDEIEAY